MLLYYLSPYLTAAASSGFFGSLESNIIGALVAALVIGAVTSFVARRRNKRTVKKKEEATQGEKLDAALALVAEMHVALVGADPTELNPSPAPGLVKDVALIKRTLYENGGKGNTVLDRLDRMEKTVTSGAAGIKRVETRQTEQRDAVTPGDANA